jgi:lipid-binding SYLF domain-containing protein
VTGIIPQRKADCTRNETLEDYRVGELPRVAKIATACQKLPGCGSQSRTPPGDVAKLDNRLASFWSTRGIVLGDPLAKSLHFGEGGVVMRKVLTFMAAVTLLPVSASAQDREQKRLKHSGEVLMEILNVPENIPKYWLDRAECVIVLPSVKKLAFGVGASIGRGAMSCRSGETFTGPWGPPAMYALEGGSIGFQLGGQATDFVLLVVNPKGARALLKSKVKLGGDASAAAGPKGRDTEAATDVTMHAEILTYSRARGLFAGVSLEGSTLRPDGSANNNLYGHDVTARQIVLEHQVSTPAAGQLMISALQKASPRNKSDAKSLQSPSQ